MVQVSKMCTDACSGIKCQYCREMEGVAKHVAENENYQCITDYEQYKVVCLKFKQRCFIQPLL